MPKRKIKNENFEHTIVKVLKNERIDDKNRIDLRIVRWKTAKCRTIENRRIWEANGGDLFRKMVGLTADDIQYILNHSEEIIQLLKEEDTHV